MKFNPHDYQRYAIEYILSHPVTAAILDMGLGKSVITLNYTGQGHKKILA